MINYDTWVKATYSDGNGGCVEFKKRTPERTAIRDSKVTDGPRLELNNGPLMAFIDAAKTGAL